MRIKATDIEKIFHLKSVRPFDRLDEIALSKLVEVMPLRRYEAGALIVTGDMICNEVLIAIEGRFSTGTVDTVSIAGIHSVLEDIPIGENVSAGKNGVSCLRIGKGHFLTMVYEFPFLLTDLIEINKRNPNYFL